MEHLTFNYALNKDIKNQDNIHVYQQTCMSLYFPLANCHVLVIPYIYCHGICY